MRSPATALGTLLLCFALVACSPGGSKEGTPGQPPPTAPTTEPTERDGARTFEDQDYSYVLTRICRCPYTAPVAITVEGGNVTSAVAAERTNTVAKGDPAPEALHLTIADILAKAADPTLARSDVQWPADQAWPDRVRIELIEGARDADIVYVISDVVIG
jgi:hypothetical protein